MPINHERHIPSLRFDDKASVTWTTGTTHTISDKRITARSLVAVFPTSMPVGHWYFTPSAGSLTITSSDDETGVTFRYLLL